MIKDSRFSQEVKIAKETAKAWSPKNAHAVDNVNVAQGPRSGNQPAQAKRNEFKDAKQARAPLAKVITNAFAGRAQDDKINSKLEPAMADVKPKKFKR